MSKALHGDSAKYIAGLLVDWISTPPVELTRLGVKIFLDSVNQLGKSHAGIQSFLEFFLAPQLINKGAATKDTLII
jgi:hypothetical protein